MMHLDRHALQQNKAVLEAALDDDLVLFHPSSGLYCRLNDTGKALWRELVEPRTASDVAFALSDHYAADPATCRSDMEPVLSTLLNNNFVLLIDPPR
jgi:hypothetical protein